jgi:hypothetical protein
MWPWVTSVVVAVIVDLIIGAVRRFDFAGINGFSTLNYGWLAFTLVGGIVFAWRIARVPAGWWILLRMLVAPVTAYVLCYVLVTLTGLVFLPDQSLAETLTTDAPGRALWLGLAVAVGSVIVELVRLGVRAYRRGRAGVATTAVP